MARTPDGARPSRRGVLVAGLGLGGLGLGGLVTACGGSDDTATSGGGSPSSQASSPSSPAGDSTTSATPTPTASGSASVSDSAAAPGGTPVTLTTVSLKFPAGWEVRDQKATMAGGFDPSLDAGQGQIFVYDLSGYSSDTIGSLAKAAQKFSNVKPLTQGANRVVGGMEGYTLTGSTAEVKSYYEWGGPVNGRQIQIQVQFLRDAPDAQAVVDSVLATVSFT